MQPVGEGRNGGGVNGGGSKDGYSYLWKRWRKTMNGINTSLDPGQGDLTFVAAWEVPGGQRKDPGARSAQFKHSDAKGNILYT